ncbi:MAG: hypothetical protein WD960_01215 [Gemmatimonadota bacterium]
MSSVLVFAGTRLIGEEIARAVERASPEVDWRVVFDSIGVTSHRQDTQLKAGGLSRVESCGRAMDP